MINNFSSDSILYYPSIEFQSETWVKASLTIWNKIYRIKPDDYKALDSDEIKIAISEGIIEDIILSEADLRKTADNFESYCNNLNWFPDGFNSSTYEVRLHDDKIDSRLKDFFREFSGPVDKQGFYRLRPEIANGYMFFLADTISKRRNIARLTDDPDMFTAMTYFDIDGKLDEWISDSEAKEHYSNLIIENMIPQDIRSISMDKIIKLSDNLNNNKAIFRESVAEFSEKLSKIEDSHFTLKEINKFKKSIEEHKQTRTEIVSSFSKNIVPSALYVGIPTFTSSLIGSIYASKEDLFSSPVQFANCAVIASVASVIDAGRQVRTSWKSKKSNYYLDLRKELTSMENSQIKIKNINYRLDEYIND